MNQLSLLRYAGSKLTFSKFVISNLDYTKKCYVELFGGSASILLNKPPHKIEIYNDHNKDLANLFYCITFHFNYMYKLLDTLIYSRAIYDHFKSELKNPFNFPDPQRAVKYYYVMNHTMRGTTNGTLMISTKKHCARDEYYRLKKLPLIKERLNKVVIENKDYRDVLKLIGNNPDVCLYVDPPYLGCNDKKFYGEIWTLDQHQELASYLHQLNCSVIISHEFHPQIIQLYQNWNIKTIKIRRSMSKKRTETTEMLIMNY